VKFKLDENLPASAAATLASKMRILG